MTLHTGRIYRKSNVSLRPPRPALIRDSSPSSDVADDVERWLSAALAHDDIYYFSVYYGDDPVGQILLHDTDEASAESLVAYYLFRPGYRGQGIGTRAIMLLQQYVKESTGLSKLTIITSVENIPSQHLAERCGFMNIGVSREDPKYLVFQWRVSASKGSK